MERQKKTIYLGIQLIRMIFSFNIVIFHCIGDKYQNKFIYFICIIAVPYYVPTFFVISFYFSYKSLVSKNIIKLKERLIRIIIPYIIWPFIFWMKNNFINIINGIKDDNKYRDLIYQLIIGKPFLPVFWFQFCLIFYSLLYIIIILLFKYIYKTIFTFLFIIILYLNYFGYTNYITNNNHFSYASLSLKDLFYRHIHVFHGFMFASINNINHKFSIKFKIIIFSLLCIFLTSNFNNKGYIKFIRVQFIVNIIFIVSVLFPNDLINNKIIFYIITQITSYTGGIYYLHYEIKYRTLSHLNLIKKADFFSCIIIYLISYIFCFLSFKIFKNTKLKYLFI